MFKSIKGKLVPHAARFTAELAPEIEFVAVGDIHGRHDLLQKMCERLAALPDLSTLIFVGDYIDRGEGSAAVLRWLRSLEDGIPGVICLRGNHEQMLLAFVEDPIGHGPAWMQNGGAQTLMSFDVAPPHGRAPAADWLYARDRLVAEMGQSLLDWVAARPLIWNTGNVVVVHAGADPDRPLHGQSEQNFLWGHADFLRVPRVDAKWIVHGHTVVDNVSAIDGRIGVDTGAYATNRLSAAFIRNGDFDVIAV